MEKDENEEIEERSDQDMIEGGIDNADDINFIQDYIERKKLQNRILKELIDNINHSDKE